MSPRVHYVFPLFEEAFLERGFRLDFDENYRLTSSKIAPMPRQQMRPTPVVVNHQIFMIGGDQSRQNLVYDTIKNNWSWLPRIPVDHNLSCNVCVNYQDQAIFTFMLDGKFTIRSAVLPLEGLRLCDNPAECQSDMDWVLEVP